MIRPEADADHAAIDRVIEDAFGRDAEARLVRQLREDGVVALSLVEDADGEIVGHVLFSWLSVTIDGRDVKALSLAPVSVATACQRQGIGGRLIEAGLQEARHLGGEAVVVLGHPDYYPRFGFKATTAANLASPFPPGPHFMAIELVPEALSGKDGRVTYPPAFGIDAPQA